MSLSKDIANYDGVAPAILTFYTLSFVMLLQDKARVVLIFCKISLECYICHCCLIFTEGKWLQDSKMAGLAYFGEHGVRKVILVTAWFDRAWDQKHKGAYFIVITD